jgi:hypothetical protein
MASAGGEPGGERGRRAGVLWVIRRGPVSACRSAVSGRLRFRPPAAPHSLQPGASFLFLASRRVKKLSRTRSRTQHCSCAFDIYERVFLPARNWFPYSEGSCAPYPAQQTRECVRTSQSFIAVVEVCGFNDWLIPFGSADRGPSNRMDCTDENRQAVSQLP